MGLTSVLRRQRFTGHVTSRADTRLSPYRSHYLLITVLYYMLIWSQLRPAWLDGAHLHMWIDACLWS